METLPKILPALQSVVMIIAAGVGAYVAVAGLNTWRRQIDNGVGRRVLAATYRVRDGIRRKRLHDTLFQHPPELIREVCERVQRHVAESSAEFDAAVMEADAAWQKRPISPDGNDLKECVQMFHAAIAEISYDPYDDKPLEGPNEATWSIVSVACQQKKGRQDPYRDQIDRAVERIEKAVGRHLRSHR